MTEPVTEQDKERFVELFLSWDIDIEYVRLSKLDVLRRATLDERYRCAKAWQRRWLNVGLRLAKTMHATLDSITPLERETRYPWESEFPPSDA